MTETVDAARFSLQCFNILIEFGLTLLCFLNNLCGIGFEGHQCEVDIDACLFHNVSCNRGTQCVDKPYELAYMCGTACQENTEVRLDKCLKWL